jgi:hypothetical protein
MVAVPTGSASPLRRRLLDGASAVTTARKGYCIDPIGKALARHHRIRVLNDYWPAGGRGDGRTVGRA